MICLDTNYLIQGLARLGDGLIEGRTAQTQELLALGPPDMAADRRTSAARDGQGAPGGDHARPRRVHPPDREVPA